jgi:hypothetical protein
MVPYLTDCQSLFPHAAEVQATSSRMTAQLGGITLYKGAVPVPWSSLPEEVQIGLLMGNRLPCFTYTFQEPKQANTWISQFIIATQQPMAALLKARKALVLERFPTVPMLPPLSDFRLHSSLKLTLNGASMNGNGQISGSGSQMPGPWVALS